MRRTTALGFKFQGDEVQDGTIRVADFAATASAIDALVQEANRTLNGDLATVSVRVRGDSFYAGSFGSTLEVALLIAEHAGNFFGNDGLKTSEELLEALGFWSKAGPGGTFAVGLIGLLKWLRGKPPKEIKTIRGGVVEVVAQDDATIHIDQSVKLLVSDPAMLPAVIKAIGALDRHGMDALEFSGADGRRTDPVQITKQDLENIERIAQQTDQRPLPERHVRQYDTWLRVVSIAFEGRSMWRFNEDGKQISARIRDEDFVSRVRQGDVRFRSGTSLKVVLETVTTRTRTGSSRTTRSVLKVLYVKDRALRRQLGFDDN